MCNTHIVKQIHDESPRRHFLKVIAGAAAAGAMLSSRVAAAEPATDRAAQTISTRNLADLTHALSPQSPVYPGYEKMKIRPLYTAAKNGFNANAWELVEHCGTHLDAPHHFIDGATTADKIDIGTFVAPLAVLDIRQKAEKLHDATVTVDDVLAWEKSHGKIPVGAAVMMNSGWSKRMDESARFLNADAQKVMHFPVFSAEAAAFLVTQRAVAGIGVDTLSLDIGAAKEFAAHRAVLQAGKWGVECVAGLDAVPPSGASVVIAPTKVLGATGGPVRIYAMWG